MSELDQSRSSEENASSLSSDLRSVYGIKGAAIGQSLAPLPSVFSAAKAKTPQLFGRNDNSSRENNMKGYK